MTDVATVEEVIKSSKTMGSKYGGRHQKGGFGRSVCTEANCRGGFFHEVFPLFSHANLFSLVLLPKTSKDINAHYCQSGY